MKTNNWSEIQIHQFDNEILWLMNEIITKKLTAAQVENYLYQIKHKELNIAFNSFAS